MVKVKLRNLELQMLGDVYRTKSSLYEAWEADSNSAALRYPLRCMWLRKVGITLVEMITQGILNRTNKA
jgi:hypothetical protein